MHARNITTTTTTTTKKKKLKKRGREEDKMHTFFFLSSFFFCFAVEVAVHFCTSFDICLLFLCFFFFFLCVCVCRSFWTSLRLSLFVGFNVGRPCCRKVSVSETGTSKYSFCFFFFLSACCPSC